MISNLFKGAVIILLCWGLVFCQQNAIAYERSDYGIWIDMDRDCQDTRQEILIRDSLITPIMKTKCKVAFGKWEDPYSGNLFLAPTALDVDHIIPLKYAEDHGAKEWTQRRKVEFGNDPENLIAVSASQNRSKGDKGPSKWLPLKSTYHCEYARSWQKLAEKYRIKLNYQDRLKVKRILAKCK